MEKYEVLFHPDGLSTTVLRETLITDAIESVGIPVQLVCGGSGRCGKCIVEIQPDAPEPGDFDRQHLSEEDLNKGMRLACQTKIDRDMRIFISNDMRLKENKILVEGIKLSLEIEPLITKKYVELPEPSLLDQVADQYRIKRALKFPLEMCPEFDIDLLRELPSILRKSDFKVTVVTSADRIIAIEPGDTTPGLYGIAFDIGTTTVVGTIVDLLTGKDISHASRLNTQVVYGEDTISRIQHTLEKPEGLKEMTEKIRAVINEIIAEAAESGGIKTDEIYEASFVGNTTMSHLFLGLDPAALSQIPFVPVANAGINLRACDAGISIHPRGNLYVLPNIAGFVGSDTLGVMLACNYLEMGPSQLAVDIGTNGELALRCDDSLMVCSTAAGPALEGAAITCGMRASNGAIEHVTITHEGIVCDVIGKGAPIIGLCGSGIIDAVAELLKMGIVDNYGRMLNCEELDGIIPDYLLDHLITVDSQPAFLLSKVAETGSGARDVIFTQKDIRQIQLAKGAISAGIHLILNEMSMTVNDIDEILLAGAFGNYIDKVSAKRIGLLPNIPSERIRFVGNAASSGSKMTLLSREARRNADIIRHKAKHIELASLPEFMNELSNNMLFQ